MEVTKSKCFGLVGIKGTVIQETFSTFRLITDSNLKKTRGNRILFRIKQLFYSDSKGFMYFLDSKKWLSSIY